MSAHLRIRLGFAALIFAAVLAAFGPALSGGFLLWDDDKNFLETNGWRGLSLENLRWMATTFHGGPYQPLAWLSLAIDHALWGMDARGYHATNLLLHAVGATVVYCAARRLFALALPATTGARLEAAAATAALFFAIHPLRVESVAWITERRDVLSGIFTALALLAYLEYGTAASRETRPRWYWVALAVFALALLAKASALALPLVFLVLDRWPLRRASGRTGRTTLAEKIPFVLLSGVFAVAALAGQAALPHGMRTIEEHGVVARLAQAAYASTFYAAKTLAPVRLSPIYELPVPFDPSAAKILVATALAVGITAVLFAARRALPAAFASWTAFLLLLAPVSGLVQTGPQLVADRYSYLSCLPFALLAAGALYSTRPKLAPWIAAAIVLALGAATWRQAGFWRDTETLFARALAIDPGSPIAHDVVARALAQRGAIDEAAEHYRRAIELAPERPIPRNNLGLILLQQGRVDAAIEQFRGALEVQDDYARARVNLGAALLRKGDATEAEAVLREAVRREPRDAGARTNLGRALLAQDRAAEAAEELEAAVAANPRLPEAHEGLALAYRKLGRADLADEHARAAQTLRQAR